jgi:hypothetical protein
MAQYYGPPGSKKRRLYERREAELARAIGSAVDAQELRDVAEGLRLAALAYFASIGKTGSARAQEWRTCTTDSIIASCRRVYAAQHGAAADDRPQAGDRG